MAKRKTNEEFLNELQIANIPITPLDTYTNNNTKICVKCNICGYQWYVLPRTILSNHGCPKCMGRVKMTTYEFSKAMSEINPDIVVLGEYSGSSNRIYVKCKKCGYEWAPIANSIKTGGVGCPNCAGNKALTNEQFLKRVKELSPSIIIRSKYNNSKSLIECECLKCGYEWKTKASSLMLGYGCANCAGNIRKDKEKFIEDLKKVLPTIRVIGDYKNAITKIHVKCSICGYEWTAKPNNLLSKEGCPNCANRLRTLKRTKTEEDFISQVSKKNPNIEIVGKYINSHTKVKCICKICGNIWNPLAWDLIQGTGCPSCAKTSTSYMEQIILYSMCFVLGKDAVLSRDKKAIGMELDVYIPEKRFAIEAGSWYWHANRINNDLEKQEKCREVGIRLIIIYDSCKTQTIPFFDDCLVFDFDIGAEDNHPTLKIIVEDLLDQMSHPHSFTTTEWSEIENTAYLKSRKITTDDFKQKLSIINDGIEVLGNYKGSRIKIACKCKKCGYEWSATPSHLLNGRSCPMCYGKKRKTTLEFKEELFKVNPNITLLSSEYKNSRTKILVSCKICGHIWNARPANLLSGYGCPECSKRKVAKKKCLTQEQFQNRMKKKGDPNVVVLGKYVNSKTKVDCICKICGYEWSTTPSSLLQGHGCKKCADKATGKAVSERKMNEEKEKEC